MRLDQTPTRLVGVRLDYHSGGASWKPKSANWSSHYNLSALLCPLMAREPSKSVVLAESKILGTVLREGSSSPRRLFRLSETLGPQRGAEKYGKTVVTRSSGGHHVWHSNSKACSSRVHFSLYSTRRVSWSERYGEYSQSMSSG
jgi:hypothetical protein